MGLITGLVTLPLAPVRGVVWVADHVTQEAERQLYDESRIRAEMLELELEFDDGLVGPEEREDREQELLGRLATVRALQAERAQDGVIEDG